MDVKRITQLMQIEHQRAKFAYEKVARAVASLTEKKDKDEFKSWAEKFPSMVASCGLLQAATFYDEKKKKKSTLGVLYDSLGEWLNTQYNIYKDVPENKDLVYYLTQKLDDPKKYMLMTKEAIKFLTWIKRFAAILTE